MKVISFTCQCRKCRRDAIDERLMREWLRTYKDFKDDKHATALATAVADLNNELAR